MEKHDRSTAADSNDADEVNEFTDSIENGTEKLLVLPLGEESKKITQVITNDTARQIMELLAERSMSASDIAGRLDVPLTTIKYNIENLMEVGLVKIERIKYSEKGRQVKIYTPVRKLIVVVPEKTSNANIVDVLKKYIGVVLAAIFTSGLIELISGRYFRSVGNRSVDLSPGYLESLPKKGITSELPVDSGDLAMGIMNESASNMLSNESFADVASSVRAPAMTSVPTPVPTPAPDYVASTISEGAAASTTHTPPVAGDVAVESVKQAIDIGFQAHIGLWFLLGCLFVITLIILVEYIHIRRKK